MNQSRELTREQVNTVIHLLASYDSQVQDGLLSLPEAQARAKKRVASLRYGRDAKDYFWIHDLQARVLVHPYKPEMVGELLANDKDPTSINYLREYTKVPDKNAGGHIQYMWQFKDDPQARKDKVSYVRNFEPWDWVVGTGVYTDDVQKAIADITKRLSLVGLGTLLLILFITAFVIARGIRLDKEREYQENFFRRLFEESPIPMIITDGKGRLVRTNSEFSALFGYAPEEAEGRMISDIIVPDGLQEKAARIRQDIVSGKLKFHETVRRTKTGEQINVKLSGTGIRLRDGSSGMIGTYTDITDRVRAEGKLRQSEADYRTIFDSSHEAIFVHDVETSRIVDVNRRTLEMYGYEKEELLRLDLKGISSGLEGFSPADSDRRLKEAAQKGELAFDWRSRRKDGRLFWTSVHLRKVTISGRECILAFVTDVSERKAAEEEKAQLENRLRHAQKMEAIGTLAGGIAHDFNNVLFAIMGYAELAERKLKEESLLANYLLQIKKASERARELVQQILTFSRQTEHRNQPLKINAVIKEAAKLIRSTIPTTIEMKLQLDDSDPAVYSDPTSLHQIVMNLCSNAAQAMGNQGGLLTLELKAVDLDGRTAGGLPDLPPGPYVQLKVADNGPGIPTKVRERIFDPFFTTKERGEGTGLGLAVVHGIAEENRGAVTVESEPGRGAVFTVFLPRYGGPVGTGKAVVDTIPRGSGSILLVDDEPAVADSGQGMLEALGYQVTAVLESQRALEIFTAEPDRFDLVLTDMSMPRMTGLELAARIKAVRPDIPVMLWTGFNDKDTNSKFREAGIAAVVMKPPLLKDLALAVKNVLDSRS